MDCLAANQTSPSEGHDRNGHSVQQGAVLERLLDCCRAFLDQGAPDPARGWEWDDIISLAHQHRLTPVVRQITASGLAASLPDGLAEELQSAVRTAAAHNLAQTAELLRLLPAMQQAGVTAVAIKGPALAQELYGDVSLRIFEDLDLLVAPHQANRALQALQALGYRVYSSRSRPPGQAVIKKLLASKRGELPLWHPARGSVLDLHWRLPGLAAEPDRPLDLALATDPLSIAGQAIERLRPEELVLLISHHGFKHGWVRLNWLLDLALALQKYGAALAADYLRRRLAGQAARVSFLAGIFLAQNLLGLAWPGWRNLVSDRWAIGRAQKLARRLAGQLHGQPFQGAEATFNHLLPLYMAANPGIGGKARQIARILMDVGHEEIDRLRLPAAWFVLYYPYRQMRLLKTYLLRPPRSAGQDRAEQ